MGGDPADARCHQPMPLNEKRFLVLEQRRLWQSPQ
jgi:hypothetical protein